MKFLGAIYLVIIFFYSLFVVIGMQGSAEPDRMTTLLISIGVGLFLSIIIWAEFILLYFILFRRFKTIGVQLTEEAIVYDNIKGRTVIPYLDIEALEFPSVKYVGGWIKIIHKRGNIKLTVVLESIGDFVKQLKDVLDNKNMSHTYNDRKLFSFYKTASYSDQSWGRIYDYLSRLLIFLAVNIGAALLFRYFDPSGKLGFLLIMSAFIMPCTCFMISEVIIGRKIAKTSKQDLIAPERSPSFEVKVYKWVFGVYSMVYLIIAVLALLR